MLDILFARTFFIVAGMLCITAVATKINRVFETAFEMWSTFIISFLLLFLLLGFSGSFPLNIFLVVAFSFVTGWMIGPSIEHFGMKFKLARYRHEKGITLEKGENMTLKQMANFESSFDQGAYHKEWQNIIFQAVMGTALAITATASIVFFTDIDFSFLEGFLFTGVVVLIAMGIINALFFRSPVFSLIRAYCGAMVFTLYLLYDFDRLKNHAGDESWSTAVEISVSIYLDIINLFLDLLEILSEAN